MKSIFTKLTLLLLVALLTSCVYNKSSYLAAFESFVEDLEQREELTDAQYTDVKKEYLDYSETYYNKYRDDLTRADKSKVNELKVRYYTALAKLGMGDVMDELENFKNQASEFLNGLFE